MSDIRVLVVDDSSVVRRVLANIIDEEPGMTLAGAAVDGVEALEMVSELKPDLMTLDLEMPRMGGLEVLAKLKIDRSKMPVIVVSSLTREGSGATLEALSRGALDYVCKPTAKGDPTAAKSDLRVELVTRIHAFGKREKPSPMASRGRGLLGRLHGTHADEERGSRPQVSSTPRREPSGTQTGASRKPPAVPPNAVVIGSSTGGPAALEVLFSRIRAPLNVPIFVVQHIPAEFSGTLAKRLDKVSGMKVVEARQGMEAEAGVVYLAPGGYHMTLYRNNRRATVRLDEGPMVNSCRPAVDVLFESAATVYGAAQLGVILTGMGRDGLVGCQRLSSLGVPILAQDQESCVIWGMPRFVTEQGIADEVLPLDEVAGRIIARVTNRGPVESTPQAHGQISSVILRASHGAKTIASKSIHTGSTAVEREFDYDRPVERFLAKTDGRVAAEIPEEETANFKLANSSRARSTGSTLQLERKPDGPQTRSSSTPAAGRLASQPQDRSSSSPDRSRDRSAEGSIERRPVGATTDRKAAVQRSATTSRRSATTKIVSSSRNESPARDARRSTKTTAAKSNSTEVDRQTRGSASIAGRVSKPETARSGRPADSERAQSRTSLRATSSVSRDRSDGSTSPTDLLREAAKKSAAARDESKQEAPGRSGRRLSVLSRRSRKG